MFSYMMRTSDDVIENLSTQLKDNDVNMDKLYDDLTKELKKRGPVDVHKDDIDWDVLCRYLITEASGR